MTDSRIVADGPERAIEGSREQISQLAQHIQAAVESEYKDRLAGAGRLRRTYLQLRMRREVKRRIARELEKIASSGGLYAKM
jgi:hypothetical protein